VSDKSRRRSRRVAAGVGVGAGVCGALITLALAAVAGLGAGPVRAPWVKEIVTGLSQRGYDWIAIDVQEGIATVSGTAPDVDSLKYGFEAAETELNHSAHASEVSLVVDATQLEGGPKGIGAALATLGATPALVNCQEAFKGTLEGRSINFAPGSADLTDDNRRLLDALSAVAIRCKSFRIEIGGHTDVTGNPRANQALSLARADAVRTYLVARGVAEGGLDTHGYGQEMPVDSARGPEADAKNRRIEFTVTES
jgi:outer membrane protein OmpA-like peptidoglycan-associated protein